MTKVNSRFAVGAKVVFVEEPKRSYTVRAIDSRYAVCTRKIYIPAQKLHTVLYTIVDNETMERSTNDRVFNPYDYTTDAGCAECLRDLAAGIIGLSRRNAVPVVFAR